MDTANILESLTRQTLLLNSLEQPEVVAVLRCCTSSRYGNSDIIYREGSHGQSLYIVLKGSVLLKRKGETAEIMRPGDCFGEMGAVSDATRTFTAEAYGDVVTLEIMGNALDVLEPSTHVKVLKNILVIITSRFNTRIC